MRTTATAYGLQFEVTTRRVKGRWECSVTASKREVLAVLDTSERIAIERAEYRLSMLGRVDLANLIGGHVGATLRAEDAYFRSQVAS